MAAKRTGLGRGIGALIPTSDQSSRPVDVFFPQTSAVATEELVAVPGARLANLSPADIVPNAVQPRVEFDREALALLENLHRSQLNPLEEASAYQQLLADFGITQEQLATRIGRSRPQITNTIRLLKLPAPVQSRVAAGVLSAGHARAILSVGDDEDAMVRLADKIVNEELSVRAAEAAASRTPKPVRSKASPGKHRGHLDEVAERLGDRLNTRVKISLGARKGQIVVDFATIQDLNRILDEIGQPTYSSPVRFT